MNSGKGTEIDLYLDQNFGHMRSFHNKRTALTTILDGIFVHTFGKLFIVHTLYHEIGHHIYDSNVPSETKENDSASEDYAEKYANEFYGKVYPLAQKYYKLINKLYHLIYRQRIAKDNEMRHQKDGLTTRES